MDAANMDVGKVKQQLSQQVMTQIVTQKIDAMTETCYEKCITSPSSRLSNSEQKCLAQCVDRYLETMQHVVKTVSDIGQQQQGLQ